MRAVSVEDVASIMPEEVSIKILKYLINFWVRQVNGAFDPADCARWWAEAAGRGRGHLGPVRDAGFAVPAT